MLKRLGAALGLALTLLGPAGAADVKISTLPLATSLAGTEYLPLILADNVTMKKVTFGTLTALFGQGHWRGTWSNATAYVLNDTVSYSGSSYIAILPGTNHQPDTSPTYWSLVAQKGADGAVTSVTCGTGLSGGTITSSGTCAITSPIPVSLGGTNATAAGGTALDNISGFASVGFVKRTGTGAYAIVADPLPMANGGLGLSSGTSGGVLCFTGATTLASSGTLSANALTLGGGAGTCPTGLGSLGTTTTLLHGNASGAPSFGSLVYADIAAGALAASGQFAGNAASVLVTPNAVWNDAAPVALTDGATITPDFSTGLNFSVTLAGNRTLANPANAKAGQSGLIRVAQDATGSRTLAYGANYKWASGTACVLSTTASKVDYLWYFVFSTSEIFLSCTLDVH